MAGQRGSGFDAYADYHAIPTGWRAEEILEQHRALGGTAPFLVAELQPGGKLSELRRDWLHYIATLEQLVDAVRGDDLASIELAVRFIELRYFGSYAGFLRQKLARALKAASLTTGQRERLDRHFLALVLARDYSQEFVDYRRLWRGVIGDTTIAKLRTHFVGKAPRWLPGLVGDGVDNGPTRGRRG